MRVLYLHQYFLEPSDGGGTRSWELARRLVRFGHEVAVVSLPDALARMFVGVGPRVEHVLELPPSPAAARRSLPVLGKVAPAVDESRGKPAADPEALKGIFPELFDDEG